jgi:hypothetical protein
MRGFPQRILLAVASFIAIVAILGACTKPTPTPVVNPRDASDAAPAWNGGPATCLDYCRRGAVLGCAWAQPTPAGASCVDVCDHYQKVSPAPWDLSCRTSKGSCGAMDGCQ